MGQGYYWWPWLALAWPGLRYNSEHLINIYTVMVHLINKIPSFPLVHFRGCSSVLSTLLVTVEVIEFVLWIALDVAVSLSILSVSSVDRLHQQSETLDHEK